MSDRIREAAADALDVFHDYGHWVVAAALVGAAAFLVVRTFLAP